MSDVNNPNAKIGQQNVDSTVYNIYGDKKIKKFLGVLPFFTDTFLGRDEDLKAVHQKLFEGNNLLLLVNGQGGIGKTTLAARYYLMYQNEYEHLAWVYVATSLADALLTLAVPFGISFPDTMPAEERIQQLLDELRNLKKPCLMVVDNANEIEDLEEHYQALRRCANFHMLLTTRIASFEQAATYKIEHLEKSTAIDLFKKYYPKHGEAENSLLEKILEAVGYNTLVIELLAKTLHSLNGLKTHYSLAQLHDDLQKKGLMELSLARPVTTPYQSTGNALRKEKPEAIIEAMYELSELAEKEITLLSVFAVLPAESIMFETLETLISDEDLEATLLSLSQKGWLDYNETGTSFKVSPVVQEITKKKNNRLLEDCRGVLSALIDKLLYQPGTGHFINVSYEQAALFARYAEAAINSFKQADDYIAFLCERVGNYHKTTGNIVKALHFYEAYKQLKKELYEAYPQNVGFKNGLAISYSKLGTTHAALGDLEKALHFYEELNRLEKELYEAYPQNVGFKNGLAVSYIKLGLVNEQKQNKDGAKYYYQLSQEHLAELVSKFPQYVEFQRNLDWVQNRLAQI